MRSVHVPVVETQPVTTRSQLQFASQHVPYKQLIALAVDHKRVEDLLKVRLAAVVLHLLEEADAVVEREAEAHLVAAEKDDQDDDDKGEKDDGGADKGHKELLIDERMAAAVVTLVVFAGHGHKELTAKRLSARFAGGDS